MSNEEINKSAGALSYEEKPTQCLECGRTESIDFEQFQGGGREAWRAIMCRHCGQQWVEIYSFSRLETIEGVAIVLPQNHKPVDGMKV